MTNSQWAWCFDHGRLHRFGPDGAWCTAAWVPLAGATETDAIADKTNRYGDAVFYDQLPLEQQVTLAEIRNG